MSARRDQTFEPAMRQRDSVERAWERRRVVSRMRVRCVSRSDWLCRWIDQFWLCGWLREWGEREAGWRGCV